MQLIAPDILAEARGLTGAMTGTIFVLGFALWLFGWRWHRFWIVAGITLAAGLLGLNAGRTTGGTQVMAIGILLAVFTAVLGLHVALRTPSSRLAILQTLSTVFFLSVGTLVCVYLIIINRQFEYQWTSFLFFVIAGVGGLWWVLNGQRPSAALTWASWFCPLGVLYCVMNILVARPGTGEVTAVALLMGAATVFFGIIPEPLLHVASQAASSLGL